MAIEVFGLAADIVLWTGDGQSVVVCLVWGSDSLPVRLPASLGRIPEFVQVGQRTHHHHHHHTTLIIMVIITIIPRDAAL